MSKIGIVTVLYNSEKVLEDFFRTLDEQTFKDFELYVIDNASQDNSLAVCNQLAQEVSFKTKIFAEKENWGVAKGNNIGIINALADKCEYILLSNNDIVLEEDTIKNLFDGMLQMNANLAVPKIYFHNTKLLWCAGGYFVKFICATNHLGWKKLDSNDYSIPKYVEYAPTCFMLIHYKVFHNIGLMDENYFVYYDDADFIWRATQVFHEKLAYIPQSLISHKESSCTQGAESDFSIYYMTRNRIYFMHKNFSKVHICVSSILYKLYNVYCKFRYHKTYLPHQRNIINNACEDAKKMFK